MAGLAANGWHDPNSYGIEELDDFEPIEEEFWHVLMGPGDVRVLGVEQLDDLYRLELVNDATLVWREGLTDWQPLGSVADGGDADAADEPDAEGPEPPWHVLVAADDIKVMPLERLDDLYRVGVIDEHTLVWQEGMGGWLPLATVAGISPEPSRPAAPPPSRAPAPAPLPSVVVHPMAHAAPRVEGLASSGTRSMAPTSLSLRPVTVPQASGGLARWTLGAALVAAALITAQRNDWGFSAAQSVRQHGAYVQAEQRWLGGPPFGSPRAVAALIARSGGLPEVVRIPESLLAGAAPARAPGAAESASSPVAPAARAEEEPAKADPPSAPADAATTSQSAAAVPTPTEQPTPTQAAAKPAPAPKASPTPARGSAPARREPVASRQAEAPAPEPPPTRPAGSPLQQEIERAVRGGAARKSSGASKASSAKTSTVAIPGARRSKAKGDEYDPLNPAL